MENRKTILVTGIGGLTPRSITGIIRENHPDYKIIGCDIEKKAMGFFMTLKDGEGLVKQYAYVSVKSYDLVGVGTTVTEAKRNYEAVIGSLSDSQVEDDKTVTATGKVVRIAGEFDGNQMQYSMILDTNPNLIFTIGADKCAELALTKEGDTVLLTYAEQERGVVKANSFDNAEFTQSKSAS